MTKKLIGLLLAAFLLVSLIALCAACRNGTQDPPQSTTGLPETTAAAEPDTADVSAPEAATEEATA